MRALVLASIASVATACGGPDSFSLHITWSVDPERQSCRLPGDTSTEPLSCRDISVRCDAKVRVRILDDDHLYYNACLPLPVGGDLCGLRDLPLPNDLAIPNHMVRIQLQVWAMDVLRAEQTPAERAAGVEPDCPTDLLFDNHGQPRLDTAPTPAVGAEIYFPVGDSALATLELGCPDFDQLDTEECRTRSIAVDAGVLVPGTWASVSASQADNLDVRFGAPVEVGGVWRLPFNALDELQQATDPDPRWRATVDGPIEGLQCVRVLEQGQGGVTPVATCAIAAVLPSAALPVTGFFVEKAQVDRLTELNGGFPIDGMVLGLVVDEDNHAVPNVTVAPFPTGDILYPNTTLDGLVPGMTSANGLFLATNTPPRETQWRATGPGGLESDNAAQGGQITGHVTIVVVRMHPPASSKP